MHEEKRIGVGAMANQMLHATNKKIDVLQEHLDGSGSGTRRLISSDEPLYWTDPR